jgi:hypothetical protein
VHSAGLADCELCATNGACRNGTFWLAIHSNRRREGCASIRRAGIKRIALMCFAAKVDQVQNASIVDSGLGLQTGLWRTEEAYTVVRANRTFCG